MITQRLPPSGSFLLLCLLCARLGAQDPVEEARAAFARLEALPVPTVPIPVAERRDASEQFEVAGGLAVTVWAESPQLFNPTAMDVDARGRIWVTEGVNYRKWKGRNPGLDHPAGDRVVILEDADGDGVCESSKVFVQDEDLVAPLGICVFGDQVLVSCSPSAILYTDTDGDDVPDEKRVFLTGFGGHDHDHGLHSFVIGPDGRWLFDAGNAGPHIVTDAAGRTLRSGSIYTGGGAEEAPNRPGLVSDDGQAWTGGLVMRVGVNGRGLEVLAHNFRNPYEVTVDSFGDLWISDNDDDGNQGCRTTWVMEGGNYGFFSADGTRTWQADRRPGQGTQAAHWHSDDPGVAPISDLTGGGAPTGVAVYEGELLPASLRGAVLGCDAGRSVVWAHHPRAQGAGRGLERDWLLRSKPPAEGEEDHSHWFRPSDVVVGTDGAVYVADWYDPVVGGHAMREGEGYGRILRIAPPDRPAPRPRLDLANVQHQLAALQGPAVGPRGLAWHRLRDGGAVALGGVVHMLETSGDRVLRARALGWLAGTDSGRPLVASALRGDDEQLAVAALRALRAVDAAPLSLLAELARTGSAGVRREVALALRTRSFEECKDVLAELCRPEHFDGSDPIMLEAIGLGARGKEAELYSALVAGIGGEPLGWSRGMARLAWRLHPEDAVPALVRRAMSATITPEAREEAVTALGFIPTRAAGQAMVVLAEAGPDDVRSRATWWVMHRSRNDWKEFGLAGQLGGSRESAELAAESPPMSSGRMELVADLTGARTLWLEVGEADNGNGYDWADWLEPTLVDVDGNEQQLTDLAWVSATAAWGNVNVGKSAGGGPLIVGGETLARGIGTHAASEIAYRLPAGRYRELRVTVAPDDGGTTQAGASTRVVFRIHVDRGDDGEDGHAQELVARILDPEGTIAARREAVTTLGTTAAGAAALLGIAQNGELPEELRLVTAEALFAAPDPAVAAMGREYFAAAGGAAAELPPITELAQLAGDRRRGQELFFGRATCHACHTFKGRGGSIGPELTPVHTKLGRLGVFDAVLDPSAAIPFGYEPWSVTTKDGAGAVGFLLADGVNVVLQDLAGQRHVFPADGIVTRKRLGVSVMPSGIALGLSAQDLADLASFLLADAEPAARGATVSLLGSDDLQGWTHHLSDGSVPASAVWSVDGGVLGCGGKPAGYLRTERDFLSFELTLEWRFPPGSAGGNSGVLLRMQAPDKVWPRSIEAQLHHQNAGDIWNIDEFGMQVDAARTQGRRTVKAHPSSEKPIGEWNRYVITLDRGDLTLAVNGVVQNTASFCEELPGKICLQSEGVPIEFRNIQIRELTHESPRNPR